MNLANWATRFRIKRPLSRKLRIAPEALVDGMAPPALGRFAADPDLDPLAGAVDFLLATYGGDAARAQRALARLDIDPAALSRLMAENELRKLTVACFRRALAQGRLDSARAALLLDFAERFDPAFARLSPPPAPEASPDVLAFDYAKRSSAKLRIVLLCGTRGVTRSHDLGDRIASAFNTEEAACTMLPGEADASEIGPNDLVLVDEGTMFRKDFGRQQAHLDKIRNVAKRMGRLIPDPWGKGFREQLERGADRYDFHWAMAPTLRQATAIPPEKFCLIPFPTGFGALFDEAAAVAPTPDLGFCGTIEDYNVHRYFWMLAALAGDTDLTIDLTSQQPDGLGVAESLKIYLARLLSTGACLSLTMRSTGDRILVGRTFDVLRGGRLLVQEYTPDARYYLRPGEDFVEVRDAGELPEVGERARTGAYEPIRAQGAATFARAYSDQAVIRHLATWV
ncbi:MAG: hypothetical protein JNL04_07505 [Rhodospirillaceae bacterium]|nr:hypothetical protein [Rhodospirillaceae bacterium]